MQTAIVNRVYAKEILLKTVWYAEVENAGGYKFTLTDNDDFVKVDEPFTRKIKYSGDTEMEIDVVDKITGAKFTTDVKEQEVDIPSNTSFYKEEQDSNIPNHYKGSENIDVIDFLYQQLPFEQFKGFMKGNMIKYPVRAGRKDDELADIKKARDYADRLIEKMEAQQ
ncbi:DUF3310 domain-containing protein [Staphylococcus haemolyticus]|nr:DUF3310 domain-containing protein [Staphylococcus haemolyticus]